MTISLEKTKQYLRVDHDEDDALIQKLIDVAEDLCLNTLRKPIDDTQLSEIAILFAVAYLYEHREQPDMAELTKNLRYILMTERQVVF